MQQGDPLIRVHNLCKSFRILKKKPGLSGAVAALFSPQYETVDAVNSISFEINPGEIVGYVGPNGAGKSTTIKMLSGILYPSSGEVSVAGFDPFQRRRQFTMNLGVMFGQKSQLWWDLPVSESFDLLKSIYRIESSRYEANLNYLDALLGIREFWSRPVRRLSLGQRVRADLAAALIHEPSLLLLDEPTIGLDVLAREKFRELIKQVNRDKNVTILITSHDLSDIELIVKRLILIDQGKVLYDGKLKSFMKKHARTSHILITFHSPPRLVSMPAGARVVEQVDNFIDLEIDTDSDTYSELLTLLPSWGRVKEIHMETASLEKVLGGLYKEKGREAL